MEIAIKQKIIQAYKIFLKHDRPLLQRGVNERSITHKFAEHLQREFPDYDVDCEYNKTGLQTKALIGLQNMFKPAPADDKKATTVFPDIIIHHRGERKKRKKNNLVVIEAKKNVKTNKRDFFKLELYKKQLNYQNACFLTFPTGQKIIDFTESQIDGFITEIK